MRERGWPQPEQQAVDGPYQAVAVPADVHAGNGMAPAAPQTRMWWRCPEAERPLVGQAEDGLCALGSEMEHASLIDHLVDPRRLRAVRPLTSMAQRRRLLARGKRHDVQGVARPCHLGMKRGGRPGSE